MVDPNPKCYLGKPHWTPFERKLKSFESSQCDNVTNLYEAIKEKMGGSSLRSFLYHLNKRQMQQTFIQQDKLERLQFDMEKGLVDIKKLERSDDICDDLFGLIELYLRKSPTGKMTVKKLLKSMKVLRLTGSKIGEVDSSLCKLTDLEVLVMAGNCLSSCPGVSLPRGLMILELYSNRMDNISALADNPPPYLLYLGLARNSLTSGVMEPLMKFKFLYHLDLAQNNIEELNPLILACSQLKNLASLTLIGNPCSVSPNYLTYITNKLPKLIFLDGELLEKYESSEDQNELEMRGVLQINVFRVMGVPQPENKNVNKKKVTHSFRLELDGSPLLRPYLLEKENSFIIDESLLQNKQMKKSTEKARKKSKKDDQSKTKKSISENENVKSKKGKKNVKQSNKSSNDVNTAQNKLAPDEKRKKGKLSNKMKNSTMLTEKENQEIEIYQLQLQSDKTSPQECFKSDRKNWGKIIEFNDPALEVSNLDLLPLRDIFRTDLTLRVVHLMTLPPVSKGKNKPNKRGKNSSSGANNVCEDDKEILISKSTLARFRVPLQDIVWSKKYLEYTWTINKPFLVEPSSDLKNLQYSVQKKKEVKKQKGQHPSGDVLLPVPSSLTCHIGVGVKRAEETNKPKLSDGL